MRKYSTEIDKKWQKHWEENKVFYAKKDKTMPKWYGLVEFPYPSAQGLHVGHPRSYTALDILSRKKRMEGYNVLYPIGFDAFGLPAENYAIKNHIHPSIITKQNIDNYRRQLKSIGFSFDWSREINTTDPEYYKWTQWIFIQLYKKGLAYKATIPINFCTSCKVGLANEEVVNGKCERCGGKIIQKEKSQWMLKITEYAERLINDLDKVDYLEKIKIQQKNWIGRSEGAKIKFRIKNSEKDIEVYTTRPDTLFGVTYMVVAPENTIIKEFKDRIENLDELEAYKYQASLKSDFERSKINKTKTGVEIKGIKVINPINNKELPVWMSDYVLSNYGTGAIMAVPAHDQRDYEFAKKFKLPIIQVIKSKNANLENEAMTKVDDGVLINSEFINGLNVDEAKIKILKYLEDKNIGKKTINYKLRDWVFSRQRYWGEPIPMIYCEKCGWLPVKEKDLPVILPSVKDFEQGEDGESPLANIKEWVETKCYCCGGNAKRETDTMPQWAGSSWYYLRYMDAHNKNELASKENIDYWGPVDWYNGGMEHTTLHLLYSRFWHKVLYDIGIVKFPEPYKKRTSHGMILGDNGEKMSKSKGNVVNPDDMVEKYGADTFRIYEMFMGPFDQTASWLDSGIKGCSKFLDRVANLKEFLYDAEEYSKDFEKPLNKLIKKVTEDIEKMNFNTCISSFMKITNEFYKKKKINKKEFTTFLQLLNPFAPHITEELNEEIGNKEKIYNMKWPVYDQNKLKDDEINLPIQINGKLKVTIRIPINLPEEEVKNIVHKNEVIQRVLKDKTVIKEIYVTNKIFNFVVR